MRAFHEVTDLSTADAGTFGESYLDGIWQGSQSMQEVYTSTGRRASNIRLHLIKVATLIKRFVFTAFASGSSRTRSQAPATGT